MIKETVGNITIGFQTIYIKDQHDGTSYERGFYLEARRPSYVNPVTTEDLTDPNGGQMILIKAVSRYSQGARQESMTLAARKRDQILNELKAAQTA